MMRFIGAASSLPSSKALFCLKSGETKLTWEQFQGLVLAKVVTVKCSNSIRGPVAPLPPPFLDLDELSRSQRERDPNVFLVHFGVIGVKP